MSSPTPSKRRSLRRAVRGGISRLRKQVLPGNRPAADLAPTPPPEAGILRPDAASWRLPNGLMEAGDHDPHPANGRWPWLPGPVVLTITILALLFISLIAWFVSRMPARPA